MLNIEEDQLKFTNDWMWRFKQRNGLQRVNFSGKANSASLTILSEEWSQLHALLLSYDRKDIYNADEIGLFFEWNQIKFSVLKQLQDVKNKISLYNNDF